MQYEVYLDVLFLENMMMDFLILLAVKKVFPCSALMEVFLPVLYRFTTDLCHFIFSMPGMDPLYPAVFPGKFLYDSDRIENPDISRFFQSMDSALSCKLSSWRYHELAPSLFWKIFPDHIFSFHPWHLWFFSFISWTFVSKETMEITRS